MHVSLPYRNEIYLAVPDVPADTGPQNMQVQRVATVIGLGMQPLMIHMYTWPHRPYAHVPSNTRLNTHL